MKRIVCFGDSNTYGFIPGKGNRYDEHTRWTGRLSELLAPKGYTVIEQGKNGRTTVFDDKTAPDRNGSEALEQLFRRMPPAEYLVMMLGTNDCKTQFHADAAMITEGMALLVSMVRMYWSDTAIWLLSPAPLETACFSGQMGSKFDADSVSKSRELPANYRELARKTGCRFLCVGDIVKADPADGVHLGAASHAILAERLAACFS